MTHQPDVAGGQISFVNQLTTSDAGTAVASWEDVNVSTITFTGTRTNAGLGQLIDVILGELTPTPIPEPASWALMLSAAGLAGFVRLRRKFVRA